MKLTKNQLRRLVETYFPLEGISIQRLIYSPSPFIGFRETKQEPPILRHGPKKPNGLWYACGDEWKQFSIDAGWSQKYNHLYELQINHYEILFIKSDKDFERFESMYGVRGELPSFNELHIDWPKVASHYAGIEICPYRWEKRMTADWYYPWDIASGCIWSAEGFKSIKEIQLDL